MKQLQLKVEKYSRRKRRRQVYHRILIALAAITVFCTTYALILPAITMEETTYCGIPEGDGHVHTAACYADTTADLESPEIWDSMMSGILLTGDGRTDLLSVAASQIGYSESEINYIVDDDGMTLHGYTRYGARAGNPYINWNTAFTAFCLDYARIDRGLLQGNDAASWLNALTATDNLVSFGVSYTPVPGDLVFYEDAERAELHVGIVYDVTETDLRVIEGDLDNAVGIKTLKNGDGSIAGFAAMSKETGTESVCDEGERAGAESAYDKSETTGAESAHAENEAADAGEVSAENAEAAAESASAESASADSASADSASNDDPASSESEVTADKGAAADASDDNGSDTNAAFETAQSEILTAASKPSGNKISLLSEDSPAAEPATVSLTAASGKTVNAVVSILWDEENKCFSSVTASITAGANLYFGIDTLSGTTWTPPVTWTAQQSSSGMVDMTDILSAATLNDRFRIRGAQSTSDPENTKNSGYTTDFGFLDMFRAVKSGFDEWLSGEYLERFGGRTPSTVAELMNAFSVYYDLPQAVIVSSEEGTDVILNAETDKSGNYSYTWEYQDEDGNWSPLPGASGASVNASLCTVLLNGGANVRCSITENGSYRCMTEAVFVNPRRTEYDRAAAEINEGLDLSRSKVYVRKTNSAPVEYTIDLSIDSKRFTDYFYYDNVAADLGIAPTAEAYKDYLAKLYISAGRGEDGLAAVQAVWDRYIYDLYDPSLDAGKLSNYTIGIYPDNTYGDKYAKWPKDAASSFNTAAGLVPTLEPLDYDYLEGSVEYDSFINNENGLEKSVTANAAGDENAERAYTVELSADVQAKATAPVAMILQIQTSWQMFDLYHSNIVSGDGNYYSLEKGSAVYNTELCNLYSIKKALIMFAEYMEEHYPGNNLVLGVTEIQHGDSSSMFYQKGQDRNSSAMYVTNDFSKILEGLYSWNSFGNCEHVHYDSDTLVAAVNALQNNLSGWTDSEDYNLAYTDIRKVAVIIGGSTENTTGTDGYGITLPWSTFAANGLNSVYGIRVNEGTPIAANEQGCISWLEYTGAGKAGAGNVGDGKTAFADGKGNTYTELYVATSTQRMFETLLQIAETEMRKQGIDIDGESLHIENVTVTDTVTDEFEFDPSVPVTATIYNKDGSVRDQRTVSVSDPKLSVIVNPDKTTTVTYDFGDVYNNARVDLKFGIKARENYIGSNNVYSNVGTPGASYEHTPADGSAVKAYHVSSDDTPEVNVPIRFSAEDGGSTAVLVGTEVELASLNTEAICRNVHELVDEYDQINGTLSYVWVLPDGTTYTVPFTSHVTGGAVDDALPGATDLSCPWTPEEEGSYTAHLQITFTPDPVTDNGNFAKDGGITQTAVNARTEEGAVLIRAVDAGGSSNMYLRKVWEDEPPEELTAVTLVINDGDGQYLAGESGSWSFVDDPAAAAQFVLSAENGWEIPVRGLPPTKTVDGQVKILKYAAEELPVPAGYEAEAGSTTRTDEEWTGYLTVELTPTGGKLTASNAKYMLIEFEYGGQTYSKTVGISIANDVSAGSSVTIETGIPLRLNESHEPLSEITITNIITYKQLTSNGSYDKKFPDSDAKSLMTSTASCVPTLTGSVTVPVLVITNKKKEPNVTTLTVTKQVVGTDGGGSFEFTASVKDGSMPEPGTGDAYTVDEDGIAHFVLTDGGSVTFTLPVGAEITVSEPVHNGYITKIVDAETVIAQSDTCTLLLDETPRQITVVNTAGYELPKTGGRGPTAVIMIGILVLAAGGAALLLLLCLSRRKGGA